MARSTADTTGEKKPFPVRWVVAGVLILLALIFIFQNTGTSRVSFLLWGIQAPAWVWLAIIFLTGVVIGSIFPWFKGRRS